MHKQNTRRGFTRFFPVPLAGKVACKAVRGGHKGFTLIELLVVVLIIGILAAIAVPQYQKAVIRSRFATIKDMTEAIAQAQEIYYLANGNYATTLSSLDIEFPAGGTVNDSDNLISYSWGYCYLGAPKNVQCTLTDAEGNFLMNYLAYQVHYSKHSGKRMCQGTKDTITEQVCKADTGPNSFVGYWSTTYATYQYN